MGGTVIPEVASLPRTAWSRLPRSHEPWNRRARSEPWRRPALDLTAAAGVWYSFMQTSHRGRRRGHERRYGRFADTAHAVRRPPQAPFSAVRPVSCDLMRKSAAVGRFIGGGVECSCIPAKPLGACVFLQVFPTPPESSLAAAHGEVFTGLTLHSSPF